MTTPTALAALADLLRTHRLTRVLGGTSCAKCGRLPADEGDQHVARVLLKAGYVPPIEEGDFRCEAGQATEAVTCTWHREHYHCAVCDGYYGVPHDTIHTGPHAHPNQVGGDKRSCACRPCKVATGRELAHD